MNHSKQIFIGLLFQMQKKNIIINKGFSFPCCTKQKDTSTATRKFFHTQVAPVVKTRMKYLQLLICSHIYNTYMPE